MIVGLITYVVGLLAATSLLLAWFHSGLPIHVISILRVFGFRRSDDDFWATLHSDWQLALNAYYPNLLSELLTCPVCLSFHVSFWIGVVSLILAPLPWFYPLVTALSWPILINLSLTKFKS